MKPKRIRTLTAVSAALAISGSVHIGAFATRAIAAVETDPAPQSGQPPQQCLFDDAPAALAESLRQRATQLDQRQADLDARETQIEQASVALATQIAELESVEAALSATLALAEDAAERDIQQLTSVYQAMKPAEAADLFAQMQPAFAAGFLARMKPDAAGGILAGLEPDHAYAVSAHLAGRNANVPTE